jgi:hypothetical protein
LRQLIQRTLDLLQVRVMHVEINQGGPDTLMAKQLLDGEKVGASF